MFGPNCLRLYSGFLEALRFTSGRSGEDRFSELTEADARRIVLLTALAFNAEFDGVDVGLNWPRNVSETETETDDGRAWGRAMLLSHPEHEECLFEAVEVAIGYLESIGSNPALDERGKGLPTHSPDFSSVDWFGKRYTFSKGNQAQAVRVLWEAWEQGEHSLSQETIGEQIESSADRFELRTTFRRRKSKSSGFELHPAWGTMINQDGKGKYRLARPKSD